MNKPLAASAVLAALVSASSAHAVTTEIGPSDDLQAALNALNAGDELVLQGGNYTQTSRLTVSATGTEPMPVIIRAKDGEVPIIERNDANQNTIDLEDSQYLVLRGIEVRGGSHGIRIRNSDFVTIEDCHIHDTADVAISANAGGEYEGLQILRNHIHDTSGTGEGMYLGCNNDACRIFNSLIEGNYVHHTNGPNVSQGDGIEIKEGSYNNVVRDNVIHDTNYPCILTYSVVGNGGPNIIERNLMWNCAANPNQPDNGIQAAADAIIRNNIILSAGGNAIANQPHQAGVPDNLEIVHNTIIQSQGNAIRASSISGTLLIANNAIYAPNGNAIQVGGSLGGVTLAGNVGVGGLQGVSGGWTDTGNIMSDFVAANYSGNTPNDVFLAMGGLPVGAADPAYLATDDFNGTPRAGAADAGAYKYDAAGNPGWTLAPEFKSPTPGGSGGGGGAGGGGASSGSGAGNGSGGATSSSGSGANDGGPRQLGADDGDCGCRIVGSPAGDNAAWFALLTMGAIVARRRR